MKNKIVKLIVIISIILIIVDQISKLLVCNLVKDSILGNENFKIEITNNTGMALGFNSGNIKNIFITILVLLLIIKFIISQLERIDKKTAVSIGLILGGGISNLIDRFLRGGVLDFIKIYKFPIFNLADVFIVCGWILLIVFLIYFSRKVEV